jgi:hypothetical protein
MFIIKRQNKKVSSCLPTHPFAAKHMPQIAPASVLPNFAARAFLPVTPQSTMIAQFSVSRDLLYLTIEKQNGQLLTHGIVHAGFSGFRRFVSRKKSQCKLICFRLVIPHDTIPSTLASILKI